MIATLCKRLARVGRSLWHRPRRRALPRHYLTLERLEDRALLSTLFGNSARIGADLDNVGGAVTLDHGFVGLRADS
jgi:hypothetical protein